MPTDVEFLRMTVSLNILFPTTSKLSNLWVPILFPLLLVSVFEYLKSSRNRTPSRCSTIMVHGPFGVSAREEHDQTDSWYQFSAKYGVDPGVLLSLHPQLLHTLEFFRRFYPSSCIKHTVFPRHWPSCILHRLWQVSYPNVRQHTRWQVSAKRVYRTKVRRGGLILLFFQGLSS